MKSVEKLLPLIVQDAKSKQVLSLFYANAESLRLMRKTGFVWRYSRRQEKQLMKGATSGNVQQLVSLAWDCDRDALLAVVKQVGNGACHLRRWSCFGKERQRCWGVLDELCEVIKERKKKPTANSYVASIVGSREKIGEKLAEEASELAEALSKKPGKEVVWEAADLLFFTLVALENRGVEVQEVLRELMRRRAGGKQAIKARGA